MIGSCQNSLILSVFGLFIQSGDADSVHKIVGFDMPGFIGIDDHVQIAVCAVGGTGGGDGTDMFFQGVPSIPNLFRNGFLTTTFMQACNIMSTFSAEIFKGVLGDGFQRCRQINLFD